MCSETSPLRFSFSHDLSELQVLQVKQDNPCIDKMLLDSNSEFEFSTSSSTLDFESSSADELFSNGVILPIHTLQEKTATALPKHTPYVESSPYTRLPPRPSSPSIDKIKKENIKELQYVSSDGMKKPHSKSFWGFSRSKSLNCDTKKSLACSLPLLSRSNSTGSVSNPKRMSSNNKQPYSAAKSSSSSYSCSTLNLYPAMQKSPSGKSYGGSYGNGIRVSPVLNVPTSRVPKGSSANLFGFGSFLRVGKVKKSKK